MVIHVFSQTNGKIIVKAMHSFIIFTREEKDLGHNVLVHSLRLYMIWVLKVIFSLVLPDIFVLFSATFTAAPSGRLWHCDCWQSCSFVLIFCTYFSSSLVAKHCRLQTDARSESFPFPTLHPNLFQFFSKHTAPCSSIRHSALLPSPLSPPLMHFHTSFLPQRLSHSTSTLFLCGFQPSK